MALINHNLQWLHHNAVRRYPLAESASGLDTTGNFTLPNDFLVGLDLPIHAGLDVDPARFFVKNIGAYGSGYSVVVGYQPAAGDAVDVATALIPRGAHTPNTVYALGGKGDFADVMGKVAVGLLDAIDQQPGGFWTFGLEAGRLEADAVRPNLRGVSSIIVSSSGQRSVPLTGDIELQAGENIQITAVLVDGQDPVIRISAISGEGLAEECICTDDGDEAPCIRRIGGVTPDATGRINLFSASACAEIVEIEHGLRLEDTCSTPCCDATELQVLTQELQRLGQETGILRNFVTRLSGSVEQMNLVVLGSRLHDNTCTTCN